LTVADVLRHGELVFTVASVYSFWATQHQGTEIFADAAAHSLLSDLSPLIARRRGHRLIVAGDFNLFYGYGDRGDSYWAGRYQTVFDRAAALGLTYMGPQHPNGLQPDPRPLGMPADSRTLATYRRRRDDPATATGQLDHVFVSEDLAGRVETAALNEPGQWGPSDHCRIRISIDL
jgi:endonuclease/exonuclease/phosphatase family metal-dependent hydrolase